MHDFVIYTSLTFQQFDTKYPGICHFMNKKGIKYFLKTDMQCDNELWVYRPSMFGYFRIDEPEDLNKSFASMNYDKEKYENKEIVDLRSFN